MPASTISKPTERARLLMRLKQALMQLVALRREVVNHPDLREFFSERAAIRQFEGKLSRADAELLALADVLAVATQAGSAATVQPAARSA